MKPYELSEFTFLLKLGLWSGGAVSGLGHVSAASKYADELPMAGLTGVWLGGGVTLERSEQERLVLSVYDPYTGRHNCFTASVDFNAAEPEDRPITMGAIENILTDILAREEKSARRGKRVATFSEYTPLREKRRYEATYTSFRTGSIPTPRRRK